MKTVGKTTRPKSNPLELVVTVEVTNRFKGLDLVARVPGKLWTEVLNTIGCGDKNHPKEK